MTNQLFRNAMPYLVRYKDGELCIMNRYRRELFSCKLRRSKSLLDLLERISSGTFRNNPDCGIESYLYVSEPFIIDGVKSKPFVEYMSRYDELLCYLNRYPKINRTPECRLDKHTIDSMQEQIKEKDAQISKLLKVVSQFSGK